MSVSAVEAHIHNTAPRRKRPRRSYVGYAFLAPALVLLALIFIAPILIALALSLTSYDLVSAPTFSGLSEYIRVLTDQNFWASIGRTIYFAGAQVPAGALMALLLAMLLNRRGIGSTVTRTVVFVPHAVSFVVVAVIWTFLYDPIVGPIDRALTAVGLPPIYWLTDPNAAMPALVVMSLWRNLGYFMIIYLAALQSIPRDLYAAAAVDGASSFQRFLHVTIPQLRNVNGFVLLTWTVGALQMFSQAYVMTGGGPTNATESIVFYLYQDAFLFLQMGEACAVAFLFFIMVGGLGLGVRVLLSRAGQS